MKMKIKDLAILYACVFVLNSFFFSRFIIFIHESYHSSPKLCKLFYSSLHFLVYFCNKICSSLVCLEFRVFFLFHPLVSKWNESTVIICFCRSIIIYNMCKKISVLKYSLIFHDQEEQTHLECC